MALFALILIILVSVVVVKIGTVALTMTGLDRRKAAFQALSAFSTTGWTTREAELLIEFEGPGVHSHRARGLAGSARAIN